ncbi:MULTISPECIES: IS66 family insertion sequence element accessory protein TnpB [unclassified Variovorax]|uniref:IS66 family insertion sequence element accessory protein TnpB n=1 Tax=unclassified Variovorax TaxID=663243 RepID=UPI003F4476C6
MELQYRDAGALKRAWDEDPEKMAFRATKAAAFQGELDRLAVLALLLGNEEPTESKAQLPKPDVNVILEGVLVAVISTTAKGLTTIKLKRKDLSAAAIESLRTALEKMGDSAEGVSLMPVCVDDDGMCVLAKHLERGRFIWPQTESGSISLSGAQLESSLRANT